MKLLDVLNAPWAIMPDRLREIQAIYATHLRGEKIDIEAVEKRLGRPLANEPAPYQVVDGVAVLQVSGVMAKRANLFSQISGGVSTQLAIRDLQMAAADTAAHSIIMVFDTPGGTVDGTSAYAAAIALANQVKPVVALADGMMCSAGYWAGSAARAIYITEPTTQVGSIGVVGEHVDKSRQDAAAGIKRTEIVAGKYKRIASSTGPLTDEGRQTLQDQVDYTYSLFVQAVATNRGVSVDKVLQDMADGRIFLGEQAIAAGLVDGVSTLDDLIATLNRERSAGAALSKPAAKAPPAPAAVSPTPPKGPAMTTREQLAAEHPALLQAILAEGAGAERARIQAVEGQLIPGHEALINTLKFDGTSSAGDAAMAVNAAERAQRKAHAAAAANEAPNPVPLKPTATVPVPKPEDDPAADVPTRAKAAWDKDSDLRAEFGGQFSTYLAYAQAQADGQVRVLKAKKE